MEVSPELFELMRGQLRSDADVLAHKSDDLHIFLSSVVLGELYFGACICRRSQEVRRTLCESRCLLLVLLG